MRWIALLLLALGMLGAAIMPNTPTPSCIGCGPFPGTVVPITEVPVP